MGNSVSDFAKEVIESHTFNKGKSTDGQQSILDDLQSCYSDPQARARSSVTNGDGTRKCGAYSGGSTNNAKKWQSLNDTQRKIFAEIIKEMFELEEERKMSYPAFPHVTECFMAVWTLKRAHNNDRAVNFTIPAAIIHETIDKLICSVGARYQHNFAAASDGLERFLSEYIQYERQNLMMATSTPAVMRLEQSQTQHEFFSSIANIVQLLLTTSENAADTNAQSITTDTTM